MAATRNKSSEERYKRRNQAVVNRNFKVRYRNPVEMGGARCDFCEGGLDEGGFYIILKSVSVFLYKDKNGGGRDFCKF